MINSVKPHALRPRCRLQGDHLQEPVPGQHVRAVPALGVLPVVRNGHRDSSSARADRRRATAGASVRHVHQRVSATVPRLAGVRLAPPAASRASPTSAAAVVVAARRARRHDDVL